MRKRLPLTILRALNRPRLTWLDIKRIAEHELAHEAARREEHWKAAADYWLGFSENATHPPGKLSRKAEF